MPFTPLHMGPGLLIKGVLQGSFSIVVFGWSQIVMDVQPLVALLTGGAVVTHGFSHTLAGATVIALFCALTGKYAHDFLLNRYCSKASNPQIGWPVAALSAFIGTFSHVALDSVLYAKMSPLYPISTAKPLLGLLSPQAVLELCIYSAILGSALYLMIRLLAPRLHADRTGQGAGRQEDQG